jgi:hypothetical protein
MMIADHILVEFLLKEEKGSQRPQASYTESFSQYLIVFADFGTRPVQGFEARASMAERF